MVKINSRIIIDYFFIAFGAFLMAIGIGVFLVEAKVVPGGVSGLSMSLYYLFGQRIPMGIIMWIFNVPLFIWGIKELGKSFGLRTFWGFTLSSLFIDLVRGDYIKSIKLQDLESIKYLLNHDFFFLILLGGLFVGLGLGIIFKFKGTTAGSDILAAIAYKHWKIKAGTVFMVTDFFVIIFAGIVIHVKNLSPDKPVLALSLYAFLLLFVSAQLVDMVISGFDYARSVFIISDKYNKISEKIMNQLSRGVTAFHGKGLYSGVEKDILYTVVRRREIHKLTELVKEVDPHAFVIISNVFEVLGEGFGARGEVDYKQLNIMRNLLKQKNQDNKV